MLISTLIYLSGGTRPGEHMVCCLFIIGQKQGHHQLSGKSDENKPFQPNQSALSIYIKIELCYFLLDQ